MCTKHRIARSVSTIFTTSAVSSISKDFKCNSNAIQLKILHFFYSSSYDKVHAQLKVCALVTKLTAICIDILNNEVNASKDEAQIQSAYKSLVEIYMTCLNIEKNWLPLFRKAFESVIEDQSIRDHSKIYIKYLKILKNLREYEVLLNESIRMLEFYPNEYIPLDMVCWIYVNKYGENDICFEVIHCLL